MLKIFIMLLTFVFISSVCQGCSFIQSKFGNHQDPQETNQQEEQKPSEPIPVDPQHS